MDYFPLSWGQPRFSNAEHNWLLNPNQVTPAATSCISHTQSPIVTGTSVVAIKYKNGVIMATDCLASYGSLARFRSESRMVAVGKNTVVGASGDVSDFQYIRHLLDDLEINEREQQDGHELDPKNVYKYLHRLQYQRRSKMNFLWNTLVVGGLSSTGDGSRFLGAVDLRGVTYMASTVATGYGAYIAQPLLREQVEGREDTLTASEALVIIENVMRILFYRDARSLNRIQVTTVDNSGVHTTAPYALSTEWGFAEKICGYGRRVQVAPEPMQT